MPGEYSTANVIPGHGQWITEISPYHGLWKVTWADAAKWLGQNTMHHPFWWPFALAQDISCSPTRALLPFHKDIFPSPQPGWIFSWLLRIPPRWWETNRSCPHSSLPLKSPLMSLLGAPEAAWEGPVKRGGAETGHPGKQPSPQWHFNIFLEDQRHLSSPCPSEEAHFSCCHCTQLHPILPPALLKSLVLLPWERICFHRGKLWWAPEVGRDSSLPSKLSLNKATLADKTWQIPHPPSQSYWGQTPVLPAAILQHTISTFNMQTCVFPCFCGLGGRGLCSLFLTLLLVAADAAPHLWSRTGGHMPSEAVKRHSGKLGRS